MIEKGIGVSVRRQCELLHVSRSRVYAPKKAESEEAIRIMHSIDRIHLEDPSAGARRMVIYLKHIGFGRINRKRVRRLMRVMGITALYPRKRTTLPGGPSGVYPYALKDVKIDHSNQVWCADITYIPLHRGFMYMVAIMDWYSRKVLSWSLSNTLDTRFCVLALKKAIQITGCVPTIVNTDQGSQFTSEDWITPLKQKGIVISMDGRGRWLDNVVVERFWRTIKYEDIYLKSYETGWELEKGIGAFIDHYNTLRPHQSLNGSTPDQVYREMTWQAA